MRSINSEEEKKENPRQNSNWLSILTFWYSIKLFNEGRKRELDEEDLTKPLDEHQSEYLGQKIASIWSKEYAKAIEKKREPSMATVIAKTFYCEFITYGVILVIMELGVRLNQPLFVGLFIKYFHPGNRNDTRPSYPPTYFNRLFAFWSPNQSPIKKSEAYFYASGVVLCSCIIVMTVHPYMMAVLHVGMKIRVACCSLIYRKSLRIKLTALGGNTIGTAVNMMSNDVTIFDMAPIFLHYLWIGPLQVVFVLYFLYKEVAYAGFIGITAIAFVIPLQACLGIRISTLRTAAATRTDARVRQMNEIIQSMQVIKMYAWESAFAGLIHKLRKRELAILLQTSYIRGMIMSFIMFGARSGIFLTILASVLMGDRITADKVFVVTSYFLILRQTMTVYFPQGVAMVSEACVSMRRIEQFMQIEETSIGDQSLLDVDWENKSRKGDKPLNQTLSSGELAKITIVHGIAKYGNDVCLDDINLEATPGMLLAIVGCVGAGKSCLLKLILGELSLFSGKLIAMGTMSYASQEPWLFAGSVRQNILFGREFDVNHYRDVVKACALTRDFSLLPYGDRSIVGERGISLSGGQRARVNLARAVYKDADIYLLDDPLSAVDIHVGQQLFEDCITKYLEKKIVILVTHQLQYLKRADQIIVMHEGAIQGRGTYSSLKSSGLGFAALLEEQTATVPHEKEKEKEKTLRAISITSAAFNSMIDIEGRKMGCGMLLCTSGHWNSLKMAFVESIYLSPFYLYFKTKPLFIPEMRTFGAVEFFNYKEYFLAGANCCGIFIMIVFFLSAQVLASSGDHFLSTWVIMEELWAYVGTVTSMGWYNGLTRDDCIWIYTTIIIATIVVAILRSLIFFTICMRSSYRLHNHMFNSIIHATMRFFNVNTSGRILNRFSKDLGAVDELLPNAFIDTTQIMLNLLGAVIVVGFVEPNLLIPTVILVIIFFLIRRIYMKTSRNVKRLEGITRSPVFAHINATLQGLPTIRCNGAERILVSEFDKIQDVHSSAWFMFLYTSRAFGFCLDLICTIYIATVTFYFCIFSDNYNGSVVGLAMTQCIGLSGLIQWGMRQSAELENQMTSVERVLEFTRVEQESDLESVPAKKPPPAWPKHGRIEFIDTSMRYSLYEPPVLQSLNLVIEPSEKVGIVGRTGAGKSSLISTLFRLAYYEGQILIDNLDIRVLGLHDLRRKISIIPQEPVLFSGTLRYNLDPFNEYSDPDMLASLIAVEIKSALTSGVACLDLMMTEGGTNVSVGERQMVCLARAILRNNNILVMDEATANVDAQTDRLIQNTIRTKFVKCTVLTIAHRLHTVMDSDRVLVMDAGIAVEFEIPHLLLQNKNSYLSEMVKRTGPGMAETLKRVAKEVFIESYEVRQREEMEEN